MLTHKEAFKKLTQMIENQNLIRHCLAVEAAMKAYAKYFGINDKKEIEKWQIAGLIHDADWEKYPEKHPQVIVEWLKKVEADDDIINAVASHGKEFGVEPKTLMAKTLRAVDELTGLIVAVALVKGKDLNNVSVESVLKKWKQKDFARGVDRQFIEESIKELGVSLEEHIKIVLLAMQEIKDKLGL